MTHNPITWDDPPAYRKHGTHYQLPTINYHNYPPLPSSTNLPVSVTRPPVLAELVLQRTAGRLQSGVLSSPIPCRTMAPNINLRKRCPILLQTRPVRCRCELHTASRKFLTLRVGPSPDPTTPTAPSNPSTFLSVKHLVRMGTTIELVVASVPIATRFKDGE